MLDTLAGDEATALECFAALAHQFGWAGPLYTRLDVEKLWQSMYPKPFTDEMWERIRGHSQWRGLHEVLTDDCWANIGMILWELAQEEEPQEGTT